MILGKICSWSTLQCGQVKSEYRSMRNGAAGLPTLLLSGPAARQGSIRVSARANIFILLCYTKQLDAPPAGRLLNGFGGVCAPQSGDCHQFPPLELAGCTRFVPAFALRGT